MHLLLGDALWNYKPLIIRLLKWGGVKEKTLV